MVKMMVGEVQKQTRAITTLCQATDKKVNQLVSTVQGFDVAVGLEGTGFTAVKSYMSETYGALGKGLAMLAEATEQANRQYIEGYLSEVGSESLDSEELEREIQILDMIIATREASLQELLKRVEGKEDHHLQIIQGLQSSIYSSQEKQRKLEEKLQKLLAFEAKSSSYFEGIGELDYLVQSGLKAISYNDGKLGLESWDGRRFARVDNSWIKKINQKWAAKEQAKMDVAIDTLDGYEIEKNETGSKSIWKLKKDGKYLDKKTNQTLFHALETCKDYLPINRYTNVELVVTKNEVVIAPGPAILGNLGTIGRNIVRGLSIIKTGVNFLEAVNNAPNVSFHKKVKEVRPDDRLPQQGLVTGGVNNAPNVDAGKQGKHQENHKNNEQEQAKGEEKSTWIDGTNGVAETQEGWQNGDWVEGREGTVKEYDTGKVVGSDGETTEIIIHIDSNGNIHGYPNIPRIKP